MSGRRASVVSRKLTEVFESAELQDEVQLDDLGLRDPTLISSKQAIEDLSTTCMFHLEIPAISVASLISFKVHPESSLDRVAENICHAFEALGDDLKEDLEKKDLTCCKETVGQFRETSSRKLTEWQAKLKEADESLYKSERARNELKRMREAYYKEVTSLRQQLMAAAKARERGEDFEADTVMQFNPQHFMADEEEEIRRLRQALADEQKMRKRENTHWQEEAKHTDERMKTKDLHIGRQAMLLEAKEKELEDEIANKLAFSEQLDLAVAEKVRLESSLKATEGELELQSQQQRLKDEEVRAAEEQHKAKEAALQAALKNLEAARRESMNSVDAGDDAPPVRKGASERKSTRRKTVLAALMRSAASSASEAVPEVAPDDLADLDDAPVVSSPSGQTKTFRRRSAAKAPPPAKFLDKEVQTEADECDSEPSPRPSRMNTFDAWRPQVNSRSAQTELTGRMVERAQELIDALPGGGAEMEKVGMLRHTSPEEEGEARPDGFHLQSEGEVRCFRHGSQERSVTAPLSELTDAPRLSPRGGSHQSCRTPAQTNRKSSDCSVEVLEEAAPAVRSPSDSKRVEVQSPDSSCPATPSASFQKDRVLPDVVRAKARPPTIKMSELSGRVEDLLVRHCPSALGQEVDGVPHQILQAKYVPARPQRAKLTPAVPASSASGGLEGTGISRLRDQASQESSSSLDMGHGGRGDSDDSEAESLVGSEIQSSMSMNAMRPIRGRAGISESELPQLRPKKVGDASLPSSSQQRSSSVENGQPPTVQVPSSAGSVPPRAITPGPSKSSNSFASKGPASSSSFTGKGLMSSTSFNAKDIGVSGIGKNGAAMPRILQNEAAGLGITGLGVSGGGAVESKAGGKTQVTLRGPKGARIGAADRLEGS